VLTPSSFYAKGDNPGVAEESFGDLPAAWKSEGSITNYRYPNLFFNVPSMA